ncbi:platelet glycoprotein IX-like [Hemicordylus capensis]|uniref:platelet glycoprotein IX-like n=1 Tax=Hemicordylus capensis TaxID=884348 RepID=UPI002303AEBC|nr:platelet glycoprotein IX-like [Hemicordylus capensis]
MNKVKLFTVEGLVMVVLFSTAQAWPCSPCICEFLEDLWGWKVDCNSLGLKEMPALPSTTRILYLQNNSLTTVLPGTLDMLHYLKEVDLSNNPWHCDCSILYLKYWLEDSHMTSLASVICTTPAFVKMRALSQLSGNELEGCRRPLPNKCLDFIWRDIVLIIMAICVLIAMSCILRYSRKLVYQVSQKQHSSEIPLLQTHDLEREKSE